MKLKKEYTVICPQCGNVHVVEPTTLMHLGTNSGHLYCEHCNEYLHLTLTDDYERMEAELWSDFVERVRLNEQDIQFFENLMKTA